MRFCTVRRYDVGDGQPSLDRVGHKFRPVITTQVYRCPVRLDEVGEDGDHPPGIQAAADFNG
jgi:hypothetical protein